MLGKALHFKLTLNPFDGPIPILQTVPLSLPSLLRLVREQCEQQRDEHKLQQQLAERHQHRLKQLGLKQRDREQQPEQDEFPEQHPQDHHCQR